jgi:hypothetical protein
MDLANASSSSGCFWPLPFVDRPSKAIPPESASDPERSTR